MRNIILLFSLVILTVSGISQDTLFKKVGDPIICKVIEIGEDEVKYKTLDYLDGPSFSISASKLNYIRLANGTVHRFEENEMMATGADNKLLEKKNAIKISPFRLLLGSLNLGFEHVQKFGLHWEGEVGLIGIGNKDNLNRNEKGAWVYGGPKMLLRKETYSKGERYYHYLHGSYFRPQIGFEYQTGIDRGYDSNLDNVESKYKLVHFGLMLNIGKQWVLGDIMTLDIWFGIGMASNNLDYDKKDLSSSYSFYGDVRSRGVLSNSGNNGEITLAGQAGLKLGVIF